MHGKGLSQILWLIIAAAVLMMGALTLTFAFQGAIGDLVGGSDASKCRQAISSQAQTSNQGRVFHAPGTCWQSQGSDTVSVIPEMPDDNEDGYVCVLDESGNWEQVNSPSSTCP